MSTKSNNKKAHGIFRHILVKVSNKVERSKISLTFLRLVENFTKQ